MVRSVLFNKRGNHEAIKRQCYRIQVQGLHFNVEIVLVRLTRGNDMAELRSER